jgi:hypothetical protein
MGVKSAIYNRIPEILQPLVRSIYFDITEIYEAVNRKMNPSKDPNTHLHSEFVDRMFDSESEYQEYRREFEEGPIAEIRNEALDKYDLLTSEEAGMGALSLNAARDYYAITRKLEPNAIIETGVCNGLSTVSILLALQKNGIGELYSIDYPFRADESLNEFRNETFEKYGGAAIPSDKEPGWIIPDELRGQWNLIIGKSQRELPKLITEVGDINMFIHDSEHSHPCMMFEYELAYEWLEDEGVILSDDITWNNSFEVFTNVRDPKLGKISNNVGYMIKW